MTTENENKRVNLLINWLEEPYYYIDKTNVKLLISCIVGFICFIYTLYFTPFNSNEVKNDLFRISIESSIAVITVILVYFFVLAKIFPSFFNKKTWTVGKHILILTAMIFVCGTTIWAYTRFKIPQSITSYSFRNVMINSSKVSLIPIIFQIFLNKRMRRLRKAYYELKIKEQKNKDIKKALLTTEVEQNITVEVYSYNKKDSVNFKINQLVYITSEANYASFFIEQKGKFRELVLRRPLIQIEKELSNYKNIVRCHKSYIVNTHYVKTYQGNAHGYRLEIKYSDLEIPVSRKFTKEQIIKFIS